MDSRSRTRRTVLLGAATGATIGLAGCLGSLTGENNGDGTENDPGAQSATDATERTITVSESGEVTADPDLAIIQAGIETTGDDADAVRDELATRGDELYDALLEFGLDEDDVTTDRYDVRTRVDYRRLEEDGVDPQSEDDLEEYTYYEGTNRFRIEIHAVDDAGAVVDVAIDAGADEVGRIEFTLSDEKREELREEALEKALAGAETEAEFVAGEVDAQVVEAKHVDTAGGDVSPVHEDVEMDDADDADDAADTELHPDDVTVRGTVKVVYVME